MQLNIMINLDNSAFEDGMELRTCLEKVIKYYEQNEGAYIIHDSNGNSVGVSELVG